MKLKKIMGTFLVLAMLVSLLPSVAIPVHAEAPDTWAEEGKAAVAGTDYTLSGDTYTIKTELGLGWVAYQVDYTDNDTLITTSDKTSKRDFSCMTIVLDAASGVFDMTGHDWLPIGNSFSSFRAAALYGKDGQTIKNLKIESDGTGLDVGFIGCGGAGETAASIHDLTFSNVQITVENTVNEELGTTSTGILAGILTDVNVSNIRVTESKIEFKSVSGLSASIGGLVGCFSGGQYQAIAVTGTPVTVTNTSTPYIGGIAGFVNNSPDAVGVINKSHCDANIKVTSTRAAYARAGGLAGSNNGKIINSYTTGSVSIDKGPFAGGIVGSNNTDVYNCFSTANVSGGADAYIGGITGENYAPYTVSNCYYAGTLTSGAEGRTGGLVGWGGGGLTYSYWLDETETIPIPANPYGSGTSECYAKTQAQLKDKNGVLAALNTNISTLSTSYTWLNWVIESGINNGMPILSGCTLSYDGNGNTGGSAPSPVAVSFGETVAATAAGSLTRTGYHLTGWNTAADGKGTTYAGGATLTVFSDMTLYAIWTADSTDEGYYYYTPSRTIAVTETNSELFSGNKGQIKAEANMTNAFSNSVEVKVTNTEEKASNFGLGAGNKVYPFDISLYIKGTNTKTEPKDGYAVTVSLPIPDNLLNERDQLSILHKSDNGTVTALKSQLNQINGVWYLVFDATEFSPYALVLRSTGTYDESAGLPYYVNSNGNTVFIGFAANGKYIAPSGVAVLFKKNAKSFTDIESHWAKDYIGFVAERELFSGTGNNKFEPDTGMTRAMLAAVIGRLYERSYGEIDALSTHSFTDCDYNKYYGKYVDWAAKEGIIEGYGNGNFGPGDQITREQTAAMFYRFADFLGAFPNNLNSSLTYTDAGTISNWAQNAVLYCQSTGILKGRDGGSFVPKQIATRAEVATIVQRFIEVTVK